MIPAAHAHFAAGSQAADYAYIPRFWIANILEIAGIYQELPPFHIVQAQIFLQG